MLQSIIRRSAKTINSNFPLLPASLVVSSKNGGEKAILVASPQYCKFQSLSTSRKESRVRLSKRMSELDLCSRREADRLIMAGDKILLKGELVDQILGQKVNSTETDISIVRNVSRHGQHSKQKPILIENEYNFDWDLMRGDTVILNKPDGYVSGQPERKEGHIPAVRLLTRANLYITNDDIGKETNETLSLGNNLHFHKKPGIRISRNRNSGTSQKNVATLHHYAPAGRLDIDSTGMLLFTRNGVIAKKLVSSSGILEKEYIARVVHAQQPTKYERSMGMRSIPKPTTDLNQLLQKQIKLLGDHKRLRPLVAAEWIETGQDDDNNFYGTLRLILKEGRKRQVRRMCREVLGMHVIDLERIRVGDVLIGDLPVGKWRPLTEKETMSILFAGRQT